MGVKEAITQLEIIATNMVGRLAETYDERERKAISKQIEAIDMGMDALKTQIDLVRCGECEEYQEWGGDKICMRLGAYKGNTKPTDFCSYGERRTK